MIEAVLFDWGSTLVEFTWDDELLAAGHRAALAAIGRADDPTAFTERYRDVVLRATPADDYAKLLRDLLGDLTDEQADAFMDAEHDTWRPAHAVLGSAQALLVSLRTRGYRTGIVANSWPEPGRLLRADIQRFGLAGLLDVIVFSPEVGARKPQPEIFLYALAALGVDPLAAMYVGDRLDTDVQGAANLGMTTVQALWFRADESASDVEPDFLAFTPMDVVNALRRLAR